MNIRKNEGFTLIELLIVVAIIGIIAAIAVPGLMRARISGNEASAIGSLRAINSAQSSFASSCGSNNYVGLLADLSKPPTTGSGEGFISKDLSADPTTKSGYVITMASIGTAVPDTSGISACNGGTLYPGYKVNADPSVKDSTGSRFFGTTMGATIYQHTDVVGIDDTGAVTAGKPLQ